MGRSVLCVDGDRNLCEVLSKALESDGWSVTTEYDGERALATITEDPPDLVLLDVFLPGRDGFSLLEALRSDAGPASTTPVVLLSGCSPTPEYKRRAATLDAAALLTKPVPLDLLKSVVAEQLGEPKRPVPTNEQAAARREHPELAGRLERFSFAALLHHLHGLRADGVLHLEAGKKRKWVQLREGYPLAVRSNLVSECLGNFLAKRGRISSKDMKESLEQIGPGRLQGEILVAMEVLSEEEVSQALREQADTKLFEIFGWGRGRFHFEFGAKLQKASGLSRRSPANLILEGVCTYMPLERIDGWLAAQAGSWVARGRSRFYRFQEIDLDAMQRRLVDELSEARPLAAYRGAEERVRRTLFALVRTGVVEVQAGAGASTAGDAAGVERAPAAAPPAAAGPEEEAQRVELQALAERFSDASFFEILDLPETASDDEIESAYARLSERAHPDRVSSAGEAVRELARRVFHQVESAYETLSDPKRRQEYVLDRKRADREAEAREEGLRAIEAERHFRDGRAALKQRAHSVALRCFGRSLELYPEEGEYFAYYGWTLHLCHPDNTSIAEEAMEHAKRGLKLAGDREKPYLLMGLLCKATGRADAAEKMFTRAVQIQPNCVEALRELRLIKMRRDKKKGIIGRLLRR
jgi:CheY-like chemotaxis protein/DnaJ-domain-containing protein 1